MAVNTDESSGVHLQGHQQREDPPGSRVVDAQDSAGSFDDPSGSVMADLFCHIQGF